MRDRFSGSASNTIDSTFTDWRNWFFLNSKFTDAGWLDCTDFKSFTWFVFALGSNEQFFFAISEPLKMLSDKKMLSLPGKRQAMSKMFFYSIIPLYS